MPRTIYGLLKATRSHQIASPSAHETADMGRLNALPPDHEPRATQYVGQMIALIERLIARGHAYVAEGHVLFSVPSMPDYGQLSRKPRDELVAGARVEVAPYKKDPADFVSLEGQKVVVLGATRLDRLGVPKKLRTVLAVVLAVGARFSGQASVCTPA